DGVVEDREARVAVPLRQVTQHLIVGAVLPDDVDHTADRRTGGQAVGSNAPQAGVRVRAERVHFTGIPGERGATGRGHGRDGPGNHVADILAVGIRPRPGAL